MTSAKVGKKVPSFQLPSTGEKEFDLKHYKGKNVVLYFYPKDSTPGCTQEGKDFTELCQNFKKKNTYIFGVSRDSLESHEKFKEKQKYKIELLSDSKEEICHLFDVIKKKSRFGKISKGIERSTFFIDEQGFLVNEWRGVKVPGHAKEVLDFITNRKQKNEN